MAGKNSGKVSFKLLVNARDLFEQRIFKKVQPRVADLVHHRWRPVTRLGTLPQQHYVVLQNILHAVALARVEILRRDSCHQTGDALQNLTNGLATRLRRMCRKHRHDQHGTEHGLNLGGVEAFFLERDECLQDGFVHRFA